MKILHTADIHLGIETFGRLDASSGINSRLTDFKKSFSFMAECALKENIDLFLFCGDAYRTADPSPTHQQMFAECLNPIAEAGIPIVMLVGNHDHPVAFGRASSIDIFKYLTGEVHLFREPEVKRIETRSGPLQLIALPWPIRSVILSKEEHRKKTPNEIRDFIEEKYVSFVRQAVEEVDTSVPVVLAAHVSVQGAEMGGSERTSMIASEPVFNVSDLALPQVDYVALGHIHKHQDRNEGAKPPVVYASSIERVSFKESEDPKGFVMVEIENRDGAKETTYRFINTPARPFVSIEIDARNEADPMLKILNTIADRNVHQAVVRVRCQVDEAQVHLVDPYEIRKALSDASVVAAVERIAEPVHRERRTVVTRESSLQEALQLYIAQHENLQGVKERLVTAAMELEREFEKKGGRGS